MLAYWALFFLSHELPAWHACSTVHRIASHLKRGTTVQLPVNLEMVWRHAKLGADMGNLFVQ